MASLTLALAQLNPIMGDIAGNAARLCQARKIAAGQGAQLLLTSELYLSAYPPEDLVCKPAFLAAVEKTVEMLAAETADGGPAILLGTPWREAGKLYNACLLLADGKIAARIFKCDLPNYGVFDEKRTFDRGALPTAIEFRGVKLGVMICEDMWTLDAAQHLRDQGAELLIIPNGSPYEAGKHELRIQSAHKRVTEAGAPLIYLNQFGGQDELVFDGHSFAMNAQGGVINTLKQFDEHIALAHFDSATKQLSLKVIDEVDVFSPEAAIYHALMVGLRDYTTKNTFDRVLLGLSGGVDSALAAILAVDALGADKVRTVMLPSPYTSHESFEDAEAAAKILGCSYDIMPIEPAMASFAEILAPAFAGRAADITEENIQSRCRGLILMALSNKSGAMLLSTGNKSEMAVGYATLYGDMCGGYAVLKDLYKTELYKVARWRNAHKPATALGPSGVVIPERILTKAPTAELKPNQTDQDSLPPYDVLDGILQGLVENELSVTELVTQGYDHATVLRVRSMLYAAEYKRRQAPPGPKITRRNFGKDRRYPITNRFREE